jgi:hypothetical protein
MEPRSISAIVRIINLSLDEVSSFESVGSPTSLSALKAFTVNEFGFVARDPRASTILHAFVFPFLSSSCTSSAHAQAMTEHHAALTPWLTKSGDEVQQ